MKQDIFSHFVKQSDGSFLPKENNNSSEKLIKVGNDTWKHTNETDKIIIEELFKEEKDEIMILGRTITEKETNISINIMYSFGKPIVISSNTKPINVPQRYNEPLSIPEIKRSFTLFKTKKYTWGQNQLWKKKDKEEVVSVTSDKDDPCPPVIEFKVIHDFDEESDKTIERFEWYAYSSKTDTKPFAEEILSITKSKDLITYKRLASTLDENKKYVLTNSSTYSFNSNTGEIGELIEKSPFQLAILYHTENVELEEVFETENLKHLEKKSYNVKIKLQDGSYRYVFGDIDEYTLFYHFYEICNKLPDIEEFNSLEECEDFKNKTFDLLAGKINDL